MKAILAKFFIDIRIVYFLFSSIKAKEIHAAFRFSRIIYLV